MGSKTYQKSGQAMNPHLLRVAGYMPSCAGDAGKDKGHGPPLSLPPMNRKSRTTKGRPIHPSQFRMQLSLKERKENRYRYVWHIPIREGHNDIPALQEKSRVVYFGFHEPKVFTEFIHWWAKKHFTELEKGSYYIDHDKLEEMMQIENYKAYED